MRRGIIRFVDRALSQMAASFDARAATYDTDAMHRWLARRAVEFADPSVDALVLDVAGGTGLAARASRSRRAVVVDVSAAMLAKARAAGVTAVVRGDALRLPLSSESVDLVLCVAALHYLADPATAVSEWRRTCRRGGRVVITSWLENGISYPLRLREAAAVERIPIEDRDASFGTPESVTGLLAGGGFQDCEVERDSFIQSSADPEVTWRATLSNGRAPHLAAAPPDVQERVRDRFLADVATDPRQIYEVLLVRGTAR